MSNPSIEPNDSPIVRWEFERDRRRLACAVRTDSSGFSYEVAVVPLWNGGQGALETFTSPRAAFHRHAAIAADLRATGWTVAAYTT